MQTDPHAVGCSGRVLEQPLERPLARARAGAQAPIPKDARPAASQRNQKRQKTIVKPADFPVTLEGIWLHSEIALQVSNMISRGQLVIKYRRKNQTKHPDDYTS